MLKNGRPPRPPRSGPGRRRDSRPPSAPPSPAHLLIRCTSHHGGRRGPGVGARRPREPGGPRRPSARGPLAVRAARPAAPRRDAAAPRALWRPRGRQPESAPRPVLAGGLRASSVTQQAVVSIWRGWQERALRQRVRASSGDDGLTLWLQDVTGTPAYKYWLQGKPAVCQSSTCGCAHYCTCQTMGLDLASVSDTGAPSVMRRRGGCGHFGRN